MILYHFFQFIPGDAVAQGEVKFIFHLNQILTVVLKFNLITLIPNLEGKKLRSW